MHEMTGEYGFTAMSHKKNIYAIQFFLTQPKSFPMFQKPSSSQITPQLVTDAVAENSSTGDYRDEDTRIEQTLSCKETSRQHQSLARHEQAQNGLTFQHHE